MKRILLCFFLLMMEVSTFSQQTEISSRFTKEYFLRKSKHQENAAKAFMVPGGLFVLLGGCGIYIAVKDETMTDRERRSLALPSLGLLSVGLFFAAISESFKKASVANKNKAFSFGLNNQFLPQIQGEGFAYHAIPSIVLKIHL